MHGYDETKSSVTDKPKFADFLRFKRFIHFLPHRRRSLKLYLRYAFTAYLIFFHLVLFIYIIF